MNHYFDLRHAHYVWSGFAANRFQTGLGRVVSINDRGTQAILQYATLHGGNIVRHHRLMVHSIEDLFSGEFTFFKTLDEALSYYATRGGRGGRSSS